MDDLTRGYGSSSSHHGSGKGHFGFRGGLGRSTPYLHRPLTNALLVFHSSSPAIASHVLHSLPIVMP